MQWREPSSCGRLRDQTCIWMEAEDVVEVWRCLRAGRDGQIRDAVDAVESKESRKMPRNLGALFQRNEVTRIQGD